MRRVFIALSVVTLLAAGGCGQTVNVTSTPEWRASLNAKTEVARTTMQRDAARKYAGSSWTSFDAAYWATVIAAADKFDRRQISQYQYDAISEQAHATRVGNKEAYFAVKKYNDSSKFIWED